MHEISWYLAPTEQKIVLTDHQKLPPRTLKLKETPYATPRPSNQIQKKRIILVA